MTFVDTNILVDLMVADSATVAAIENQIKLARQPLIISDAVLVEICSLLAFNPRFNLPRAVIYDGLQDILARSEFLPGGKVREALALFAKRRTLDIVDCLLASYASGRQNAVLTNDKDLQKVLA